MLENGDRLPEISARDRDGQTVELAALVDGRWGVILLYRGHW